MWLHCRGCVNPSSTMALTSVWIQWPLMSSPLFAVPHCYPLHKAAALFVHCDKCWVSLQKFICIMGCTQQALALSPYEMNVYPGPPADLGNKVFCKANIWLEVSSKWFWSMKKMSWCWILALSRDNSKDKVKRCNICRESECLKLKMEQVTDERKFRSTEAAV